MYFLEMIKNKTIDDAHVQLYKYKDKWRVYASYATDDTEQTSLNQTVRFRSFSDEVEALDFYESLDTSHTIVTFVTDNR